MIHHYWRTIGLWWSRPRTLQGASLIILMVSSTSLFRRKIKQSKNKNLMELKFKKISCSVSSTWFFTIKSFLAQREKGGSLLLGTNAKPLSFHHRIKGGPVPCLHPHADLIGPQSFAILPWRWGRAWGEPIWQVNTEEPPPPFRQSAWQQYRRTMWDLGKVDLRGHVWIWKDSSPAALSARRLSGAMLMAFPPLVLRAESASFVLVVISQALEPPQVRRQL